MMLLTFVRIDELRNSTWGEFDFEKSVWRLSPERTKKETVHIVPLSQQAIELLKEFQATPSSGRHLPAQAGFASYAGHKFKIS